MRTMAKLFIFRSKLTELTSVQRYFLPFNGYFSISCSRNNKLDLHITP